MNIVISSQGQSLDSPIDYRFGRSAWFIQYNTAEKTCTGVSNPGGQQSGGAGVAAAQFVIDQGVDAAISGDFGPHAANALRVAGVKMYLFAGDLTNVQSAVDQFIAGALPAFDPE